MKLRWYITERKVTNWNDRTDQHETIVYADKPVLQMLVNKKWVTVPTVLQKGKFK